MLYQKLGNAMAIRMPFGFELEYLALDLKI